MIEFPVVKKFLIYTLVASLIIAALVAVGAALFSDFKSDFIHKTYAVLASVIIHSLISLLFVWNDDRKPKLQFFIDTVFYLIVASFAVTVLDIWNILDHANALRSYVMFFYLAFASLHADILSKASGKKTYLDNIIYAGYLFITIVVVMLIPTIFIENATKVLPTVYFRILAASTIVDGTLSVLAMIFYWLIRRSNPELFAQDQVDPSSGFLALCFAFILVVLFFITLGTVMRF